MMTPTLNNHKVSMLTHSVTKLEVWLKKTLLDKDKNLLPNNKSLRSTLLRFNQFTNIKSTTKKSKFNRTKSTKDKSKLCRIKRVSKKSSSIRSKISTKRISRRPSHKIIQLLEFQCKE